MAKYNWKFSTIGGVTRVNIDSGRDIEHLAELDQKLWTVLSCPVKGLELDGKTLEMVDADGDGRIHVNDVIATVEWLKKALGNLDVLLKREDSLPFSAFNDKTEEGQALLASARQILSNLGITKESISVADTSDSIAIFANTKLNGDGIVTPESTDDEGLKDVISKAVATVGSVQDRSGVAGINSELAEKFYAELAAYTAWIDAGHADKAIFPFGNDTEAAWSACMAVKDKIADYFMRCKLADFHSDSVSVLDVTSDRIGAISDRNLSSCIGDIAEYPLAKVTSSQMLPLKNGINPAWKAQIGTLRTLVLDKVMAGKDELSESDWLSVLAGFDAYNAWKDSEAGQSVSSLGYDTVHRIFSDNRKDDLLKLIGEDLALKAESESIDQVNRLTHLNRDFYTLLCNFVTLKDFYSRKELAIFQAGTLYVDQRSCDLCIKVSDMSKHTSMPDLSNMFIVYCNCVSKHSAETMTIAAVITNGDVNDLREGKNAVFYDRSGNDWDATITKVVDNPISVRQAFLRPYRRFGQFVEESINKFASDKDAKVMASLNSAVTAKVEGGEAKPPFDIAKFAGIFAAIGLAFTGLVKVVHDLFAGLSKLNAWGWLGLIVGIIVLISGPAMIMAWLKLRRRNLSPILNANGWAVNARTLINIPFGSTLTSMTSMPKLVVGKDPFADRKIKIWQKILIWLIVVIAAVAAFMHYIVGIDLLDWIRMNLFFKI
ncbi:MAG: hypothetical protein MJY77_07925 [Bacteroidaceae bacterium]|nr:hypothetical protein [Bacteroidaceae bacterium]